MVLVRSFTLVMLWVLSRHRAWGFWGIVFSWPICSHAGIASFRRLCMQICYARAERGPTWATSDDALVLIEMSP